jgi:hypothetical protein
MPDPLHAIHGMPWRTLLLRASAAGQGPSTTARSAPRLSLAVPCFMPQICPKGASPRTRSGLPPGGCAGRCGRRSWPEEEGLQAASTPHGRPRSWAGRHCDLQFLCTRRDRSCPPVSADSRCGTDPARTGRDPHQPHHGTPAALFLRPARRTVHGRGHRRGRRPC